MTLFRCFLFGRSFFHIFVQTDTNLSVMMVHKKKSTFGLCFIMFGDNFPCFSRLLFILFLNVSFNFALLLFFIFVGFILTFTAVR